MSYEKMNPILKGLRIDEEGTVTCGNLNETKISKFKGRPKQWGGTIVSVKKTNAETIKQKEKESEEEYKKDKEKDKKRPMIAALWGDAETWKEKRDKDISKSKKKLDVGKKTLEKYRSSRNIGNVKDLKNIEVRTEKGKLVHTIKDFIKEQGILEYKGKKYTPIGRSYVGDEYVDNLKLRHEEISQTVYVDAFCHTDKVVKDSEDELEVPRYKVTITDGVVVNVKKYDYDTIIFNKELD